MSLKDILSKPFVILICLFLNILLSLSQYLGTAGVKWISSAVSYTAWIAWYSLTAHLVPCGEVSATYFSPALCHLWGRAALAKFLLLCLMYPHLYLFVAPMAHWNFSSARLNFFKVSLICECLPKSAFTRFLLFVREVSGQVYWLLLILQPLLRPVCLFLDAQVVLNLITP